ncbi:MAG: homocysteine S-methyltransferase family protein [bacterium]
MDKTEFSEIVWSKVLVLDGVMGTMLQPHLPPGSCVDMANIEHGEMVESLYKQYLNAGTDLLSTNTFGANRIKLNEFNVGNLTKEINYTAAKIAKKVAGDKVKVTGIIGPTGKLINPLGKFTFSEALQTFKEQAEALAEGGVDLFLLETFADLKEIKAAVIAIKESTDLPIIASMTYEDEFTTFTGTDPATAANVLSSLGVDAVGVNCSTGPEPMLEVVGRYAQSFNIPILVEPNAGLPQLKNGKTVFHVTAEKMAEFAEKFVQIGANIVGTCCGSTPEFTKALRNKLDNATPVKRSMNVVLKLSSRVKTVEIGSGLPFCIIGERINPTNRKDLEQAILHSELSLIQQEAMKEEKEGAHLLDVNIGVPGINEPEFMQKAVQGIENVVSTPLCIDSTDPAAVEAALIECAGKPLINSVHGSTESMGKIIPLAAKYGAGLLCLAIGEKGIPKTAEKRIKILRKIIARAEKQGIAKKDLICDCLTLTVSAQQKRAEATLDAVGRVKKELGLSTVLGVSNISYGLPQRSLINSVFLSMAMSHGLDAAIINPGDPRMMEIVRAASVLTTRDKDSRKFISSFKKKKKKKAKVHPVTDSDKDQTREIFQAVVTGNKNDIERLVNQALKDGEKPIEINNNYLIPAIEEVGNLYDKKEIYLPQMILSAETMQRAFHIIEPHFKKEDISKSGKVIVCTVKGDVHDIGKNIVALFLKNQGFEVIDLGKDISTDTILKKVKELKPDVIGLSALMTTTIVQMPKIIKALQNHNITTKVVVGGAVVTKKYAKQINADGYAKDGVGAVKIIDKIIKKS